MNTLHKLKTLLTDLLDKVLRRKWHITCMACSWEVHNLEHRRYAERRADMHSRNAHSVRPDRSYRPAYVWHARA